MTRRLATHLQSLPLLQAQDFVIEREQALGSGLTRRQIEDRLARKAWRQLLPGVYLASATSPTRRQQLIAALLYAGPESAVDGVDACRFHGVKAAVVDPRIVAVVVPWGADARSRGFVRVRRTTRPFHVVRTERLRYLEPAAAPLAAARRMRSDRAVLALLSDAVERGVVSAEDLMLAHVAGPPKNARATDRALSQIVAGVRSAPEGDWRRLAEASAVLPPLLYNRFLRLPSGLIVSPDALAPDAPLVHETNGRKAHARQDLFEDMQVRHERLTDAGMTVLHSTPRRLALHGGEVVRAFERTYLRLAGQGLPPGVLLLPESFRPASMAS